MPKRTTSGDDDRANRSGDGRGRAAALGAAEELPYAVELWTLTRTQVEQVLGRASSMTLARAIFDAAQTEHLGRRITLRKGGEVLAQAG